MMEVINFILGAVLIVVMFFFAYMSSHLVSEKKAGKTIPLPWEKNYEEQDINSNRSQTNGEKRKKQNANAVAKRVVFEKHEVEYTDGDNT